MNSSGSGTSVRPRRGVRERDQPVGLAAPVGCVEPKDRGCFAARAAQAAADIREQLAEALGGVGVREETGGVCVLRTRVAANHARQVGREVGLHGAGKHIGSGYTGIKDQWDHAGLYSLLSCELPRHERVRLSGGLVRGLPADPSPDPRCFVRLDRIGDGRRAQYAVLRLALHAQRVQQLAQDDATPRRIRRVYVVYDVEVGSTNRERIKSARSA